MSQMQDRKSQSQKIEDARDLQSKLYREIGISAVAAALRFTSPHESRSKPEPAVQPVPQARTLAA